MHILPWHRKLLQQQIELSLPLTPEIGTLMGGTGLSQALLRNFLKAGLKWSGDL